MEMTFVPMLVICLCSSTNQTLQREILLVPAHLHTFLLLEPLSNIQHQHLPLFLAFENLTLAILKDLGVPHSRMGFPIFRHGRIAAVHIPTFHIKMLEPSFRLLPLAPHGVTNCSKTRQLMTLLPQYRVELIWTLRMRNGY